ncbi:hypothetical protein HPB47_017719 [Ixodes persulcatus]|uniref:Uncharacterized protein n=1 Tax=Ixodes persulcatus TaxID=34615 RepID=A0AC60QQ57_IXOPE|nr:hypothetical protein HPB47_017719 [Ixodes persulcatus]
MKLPDPFEYSEELPQHGVLSSQVPPSTADTGTKSGSIKLANKSVQASCTVCNPVLDHLTHHHYPKIIVEGTAPIGKKSSLRFSGSIVTYRLPKTAYCITAVVLGAVFLSPMVYFIVAQKEDFKQHLHVSRSRSEAATEELVMASGAASEDAADQRKIADGYADEIRWQQ